MKKKIRILFVQPTSQFSGSLKSLEEYLKLLSKKKYKLFFLTPKGRSSDILKTYGQVFSSYGISKFDNTEIGKYGGLRWMILLREIFFIIPSLISSFKIKKKLNNIDIIHVNDITALPTLLILKLFFKANTIVHIRTVLNKTNMISKIIGGILIKKVDKVLTIDSTVKKSLPKKVNSIIVRNLLINKNRIKINKKPNKYLRLGYIGSFLKYKGVEDLIISTNNLISKKYKIKLFLAGQLLRKNNRLLNLILSFLKLNNNIEQKYLLKTKGIINLGVIKKLENFYKKIDILVFPSYLNALGRQVFEAGFYKKPSIVCLNTNNSDCFKNKKTGLAYRNKRNIAQLENCILYFYRNKKKIVEMGESAHKIVKKNYNTEKNLTKLEKIYKDLVC